MQLGVFHDRRGHVEDRCLDAADDQRQRGHRITEMHSTITIAIAADVEEYVDQFGNVPVRRVEQLEQGGNVNVGQLQPK
ncbi:hypothetical protein ACNQQN_24890 [Mycobacteroides chelonae]|uniref:hypothetical protein n=1 Tax=Mycobacteroides chelonae TaxID=1774 RepID=UPI003AAE063E